MTRINFSFTKFLDFITDPVKDHTLTLKSELRLYSREGSFILTEIELEEDDNGAPVVGELFFTRGDCTIKCHHASYISGKQWEIASIVKKTEQRDDADSLSLAEQNLIDFFYALGLTYTPDSVDKSENPHYIGVTTPIQESATALLRGKLR